MLVITYFKQLFSLWITWVFTGIDILAFIIGVSYPHLSIPAWGYWTIAGTGFVIANIILFTQQQEKINYYESAEANLQINLIKTGTYITNFVQIRQKIYNEGLADNGIPMKSNIEAKFEIENLGMEEGELLWEVDLEKSELPEIFSLIGSEVDGNFTGHSTTEIKGRTRVDYTWNLVLASSVDDPIRFTQVLKENPQFKIFLSYKTKRIGGLSKPTTLLISGDFSEYREQLIEKWKKRGLNDLIEILQQKDTTLT